MFLGPIVQNALSTKQCIKNKHKTHYMPVMSCMIDALHVHLMLYLLGVLTPMFTEMPTWKREIVAGA